MFTPEPTPTWFSSTEPITAAVSGATVSDSPSPNTTSPGRTPVKYVVPGPMPARRTSPVATTRGPIVIGMRGPMRCDSRPARGESTSMSTVIGSNDAPAPSAEYPRSCWRCSTSKNVVAPSAE